LNSYYVNGGNPTGILRYPELVDSLSGEAIQKASQKYFDMDNYVQVVLLPEKN
jgi:zinc protease